jgi:FtsP/CotA-like multicopper oxidase with cupredoxin domain
MKFFNLTKINETCSVTDPPKNLENTTMCLSQTRMRPFFYDGSRFNFNGHYSFTDHGHSDDPQIGTTEDWFFINAIFFGHPIHVHLINYQVIAQGTLKSFTVSNLGRTLQCSLYEIDFYKNVSLLNKTEQNLTKLCIATKQILFNNTATNEILSKANLEDSLNKDDSSVSGFDVLKTFSLSNKAESSYYNSSLLTCPNATNNLKYLCGPMDPSAVPEYQKRWKEVTQLEGYTVRQVRIRWTHTEYDPINGSVYPYFNVPEDQLIEYPGYVYHCHFLPHEDNELMRSFMMKPSAQFDKHYQPTG